MSNPKPINQSAYESTVNKSKEDEGLWRVGSDYHEISQMDDEFITTAYYHALSKLGEHGHRISRAISSIKKFKQKMQELAEEMERRDKSHMLPCTPKQAILKHADIQEIIQPDEG